MSKIAKNVFLDVIAFLYIGWGIVAVFNTLYNGGSEYVFYFCYTALIVIGIGIFSRNGSLILSQLNILAIPLLFWSIDFIYSVAIGNGTTLFGIVDYIFAPGAILGRIISMQHLFNLPLTLLALYLIKLDRKDAWKISGLEMIAIYLVSIILTSEVNNINCVYNSCVNFVGNSFYPIKWIALTFLMILGTNFVITRIPWLSKKTKTVN